jgi:hypothetical protein
VRLSGPEVRFVGIGSHHSACPQPWPARYLHVVFSGCRTWLAQWCDSHAPAFTESMLLRNCQLRSWRNELPGRQVGKRNLITLASVSDWPRFKGHMNIMRAPQIAREEG